MHQRHGRPVLSSIVTFPLNTAQTTFGKYRKCSKQCCRPDSSLKQQQNAADPFIILYKSLFRQFTSPAGRNVHSMLTNTTEAVSTLEDSHSESCLINVCNNPPKTWLQSLILVCIKQVFSAHCDSSNYIICIHINHLTISCNSSFNEKKKGWSNWPWLISCETPPNYLFLLLYHLASMDSLPSSVLNKAHRELTLSTPITHTVYVGLFWFVWLAAFSVFVVVAFLKNSLVQLNSGPIPSKK